MSYIDGDRLSRLRLPDFLAAALLALSALALAVAPAWMPATYSWLRHTTSESAAQGVPGAWLARLGFLMFGLVVGWLAARRQIRWSPLTRAALGAFGVFMTAAAAFSTRPWWAGAGFDPQEDLLHSIAATTMGVAFALGLAARAVQRAQDRVGLALDVIGIAASVILPIAMSLLPDWTGLLQRLMFATAYSWYVAECLRHTQPVEDRHVA